MARCDCRSAACGLVQPLDARADPAQHLVGIGPDHRGDLAHIDAILALLSDDDHLIPWFDLKVAHLDHDHVHADRSDDRHSTAANQHLAPTGEAEVETIGISGGHDGNAAGTWRSPSRAITDDV